MNIGEISLLVVSLIGIVLFCQFLYEIWDDKDKKKKKGDFYY